MALTKPSGGDPFNSGSTKSTTIVGAVVDDINQRPISVKQSSIGATGDGSTDDTSAIASAIASGRELYFPPGTYVVSSALDFTGLSDVTLRGLGGIRSVNSAPAATIKFTQSGAGNGITALGTTGFRIKDLALMYNNGSFTGNLVNASTNGGTRSTNFVVDNVWAGGSGVSTANSLFKISGAISTRFDELIAFKADYAIESDGGNSAQCLIVHPTSTLLDLGFLHNVPNTTTIIDPVGEPLSSGAAGFLVQDAGSVVNTLRIDNPWFGDVTTTGGAWISAEEVRGLTVTGGYVGIGTTTTFLKSTSSGAHPWRGVRVIGVQLIDDNPLTGTTFDPGTTTFSNEIEFHGCELWQGANRTSFETVAVSNGSNYTCTPGTRIVQVANSGGSSTITLPSATKFFGKQIQVTRAGTGTGTITIAAAAGNVNNAASITLSTTTGATIILTSNGTDWWGG